MAFTIHDLDRDTNIMTFQENHVSLYATLLYNGTPVYVDNPVFRLLTTGTSGDVTPELLRPLQPLDTGEVGRYWATFLTNDMAPGNYLAVCQGTYKGNPITFIANFSLGAVSRKQAMIDNLRSALGDKYNQWVPSQYMVFDPTAHRWQDGELWDALQRATDDMNNAIPPTPGEFEVWTVPSVSFLIMGAQIYALLAKGILEASNFFDLSLPVRVNLYRGDKYKDMATFFQQNYYSKLDYWKSAYIINNLKPKVVTMLRVPMRVLRPLSDNLSFHSVGGWY